MLLLWGVLGAALGQDLKKRFEFEYSFKGPYIAQTDGKIPFWSHHNHAIPGDENVRLVPSLRSRQGSIWTKKMFGKDWWEVEIHIRISGRGKIGADGMAVWYTVEGSPPEHNADYTVYGSRNNWMGLGIILDSFDNNAQQDNPIIMAFVNDGTKHYKHEQDGGKEELFNCRKDFRNKPYPVRLKITYFKNKLTLYYHNGLSELDDYEFCGQAENVVLEKGYFGLSAATGGLSDDHDVLKFLTHSISNPEDAPEGTVESEEEKKAREDIERAYKEREDQWREEQKKFEEANPDKAIPKADAAMGGTLDPQIQAIFQVQTGIQKSLQEVFSQLKQASTAIDMLPQKLNPQHLATASPNPTVAAGAANPNAATRQDINNVIQRQNDLTSAVSQIKAQLQDLGTKTNQIITKVQSPGNPGKEFDNIEAKQARELQKQQMNDIRQDLQLLRRSVEIVQKDKGCPPMPEVSCVSSPIFVLFTLAQVGLIAFIIHYRMNQEAAAKKFF